jgi:hypothetical protein
MIYTLLYIYILFKPVVYANMEDPLEQKTMQEINRVYQDAEFKHLQSRVDKLEWVSKKFLGRPYVLNNLGDGFNAAIDQYPLYRVDVFDCETYVEMMLALANANNVDEFKKQVINIRYQHLPATFLNRNVFPEVDWNHSNEEKGYIKDITADIVDKHGQPIYQISSVYIDRAGWLKKLSSYDCRKRNQNQKMDKVKNIHKMQKEGQYLKGELAETKYLTINQLNEMTLSQIPNGTIVEMVRRNWNTKSSMGTDLNISHMGFAFWKKGVLYFREASSIYHRTVDVKLMDYVKQQKKYSRTFVGIHLEQVIP